MSHPRDAFGKSKTVQTPLGERQVYPLAALTDAGLGEIRHLPYSIKVLLESCLRNYDGEIVTEEDLKALASYDATRPGNTEIPFLPGRVVLQDFTGVPAVVDLAAMRSAIVRMTGSEQSAQKMKPTSLPGCCIGPAGRSPRRGARLTSARWR